MGIKDKIRGWLMSLLRLDNTIQKTLGVRPQIAQDMQECISAWKDIYTKNPPWLDAAKGKTLALGSVVCSDVAKKAIGELSVTASSNGGEDAVARDFFEESIMPFIRQQTEYALAMGGVVMRPWFDVYSSSIKVGWYTADQVIPTAWHNRKLTGCILIDSYTYDDSGNTKVYTKLESHGVDENGVYSIKTKVFRSATQGTLGQEVPLSEVPLWANITPVVTIENPVASTFVYIATPWANNEAVNSPVGCSLYKDAVSTFEEIDLTWASLRWERESGEAAVFINDSMVKTKLSSDGHRVDVMSPVEKRMYRRLEGKEDLVEKWTPELRFEAYISNIKFNLSLACTQMHLDSGAYIFDESAGVVTATEIIAKQQQTYGTLVDIQKQMLEPAIRDIVDVVRQLQMLYSLPSIAPNVEIGIDFGDSILVDEESDRTNAQAEVALGLRSKLSYLMEYRGMSEDEARREQSLISAEQPSIDLNMFGA